MDYVKAREHARILDFSCTGDIVSRAKNPKTQRKTRKHGLKDRAFGFLAEAVGFEPTVP